MTKDKSFQATAQVVGKSQLAKDLGSGLKNLGYELSDTGPLDLAVWVQNLPSQKCQLLDMGDSDWAEAAEGEMYSAIQAAAKSYPRLTGRKGRLVFVIPVFSMSGADGFAASAGAGEGVRVLAKSLAKEWGRDEILVHSLALNAAHFLGKKLGAEMSVDMSLSDPALKELAEPKTDLAGFLNLLASKETDFWTGATITLDGGVWMA